MALIGQYRDVCTADAHGQLASHSRRGARVEFTGGDQRRRANITQILCTVHVLCGKQFVSGQIALRIIACQILPDGGDLCRVGCLIFVAEPARQRLACVGVRAVLSCLAGACNDARALFRAAIEHAVEYDQSRQKLRVLQRERPRHQPAHREADNRCLRQTKVCQQFAQLLGIARQAGVRIRPRAGAVAQHVVGNDPIMRGQPDDLAAPHLFVQAHSVNQHHGVALAGSQVAGTRRGALSGELNHGSLLRRR